MIEYEIWADYETRREYEPYRYFGFVDEYTLTDYDIEYTRENVVDWIRHYLKQWNAVHRMDIHLVTGFYIEEYDNEKLTYRSLDYAL